MLFVLFILLILILYFIYYIIKQKSNTVKIKNNNNNNKKLDKNQECNQNDNLLLNIFNILYKNLLLKQDDLNNYKFSFQLVLLSKKYVKKELLFKKLKDKFILRLK